MRYQVILVPGCITLRESTVDRLLAFAGSGGRVVILGKRPSAWTAYSPKR
ncbi:hypothetical protein LC724_22405 [Blautia sp. RD014234]|nr:hypothetical protein [Blautia parvula]